MPLVYFRVGYTPHLWGRANEWMACIQFIFTTLFNKNIVLQSISFWNFDIDKCLMVVKILLKKLSKYKKILCNVCLCTSIEVHVCVVVYTQSMCVLCVCLRVCSREKFGAWLRSHPPPPGLGTDLRHLRTYKRTLLKCLVNSVGQQMVGKKIAQRCVTLQLPKSLNELTNLYKQDYSTVRHTLTNSLGILMLGTFYSYSWVIFI